jgi:hypothetical protein
MSISTYKQVVVWVVAVLALVVLAGCVSNIHGGGVIGLFEVGTGNGPGLPGDASVGLTMNCNDGRNMFSSVIHWTDNTNGVNFTARLPWTPVEDLFGGDITTCEQAAAIVDELGASFGGGILNSQGQESGQVVVGVSVPGFRPDVCGDLQLVVIEAIGTADVLPGGSYFAAGCLDHGKIVFQ